MPDDSIIISHAEPGAGAWTRGTTLVVGDHPAAGVATEVAGLHVDHADDEAWYVVSGALRFRLTDREVIAEAGSTVLVPAGVPHTFGNAGPDPSRFLIILTPNLAELISRLDRTDRAEHPALYRAHQSELLE
ncbi:MAG: cupin domain-containing protein [Nitrososphaerales archaeon]